MSKAISWLKDNNLNELINTFQDLDIESINDIMFKQFAKSKDKRGKFIKQWKRLCDVDESILGKLFDVLCNQHNLEEKVDLNSSFVIVLNDHERKALSDLKDKISKHQKRINDIPDYQETIEASKNELLKELKKRCEFLIGIIKQRHDKLAANINELNNEINTKIKDVKTELTKELNMLNDTKNKCNDSIKHTSIQDSNDITNIIDTLDNKDNIADNITNSLNSLSNHNELPPNQFSKLCINFDEANAVNALKEFLYIDIEQKDDNDNATRIIYEDIKIHNVKTCLKYSDSASNSNIYICTGNIIEFSGECIVNPANTSLMKGKGNTVDGAITEAGGAVLAKYRGDLPIIKKNGDDEVRCNTGQAILTKSGKNDDDIKDNDCKLMCDYIIHAVSPDYGKNDGRDIKIKDGLLENTYKAVMLIAKAKKIKSIAYPLLSCGNYKGNRDIKDLISIGIKSIKKYLYNNVNVYIIGYKSDEIKILKDESLSIIGVPNVEWRTNAINIDSNNCVFQ